ATRRRAPRSPASRSPRLRLRARCSTGPFRRTAQPASVRISSWPAPTRTRAPSASRTVRTRCIATRSAVWSSVNTPDMSAEEFAGTMPVSERQRFDEAALVRYLRAQLEGFATLAKVEQFRGGQSNPTFLLTAGDGRQYVLRRKPSGVLLPSAHAVDREFRVISSLYGSTVPVARPFFLRTDDSVIGTMVYVMGYAAGRNFWDATLPALAPAERAAIYDEMNRVLAALHTLDYAALGLADYGKPGNYFARQIGRWSTQYR